MHVTLHNSKYCELAIRMFDALGSMLVVKADGTMMNLHLIRYTD